VSAGRDARLGVKPAGRLERAVLMLRFQEDLSEATVARLLRLPVGTVKTLARRGLARLRAELTPPAQDYVPSGREVR
jgi:DNA-directed RNA polymerase specialized sigma24 family protein